MLRSALLSALLLTALGFGVAPTASAAAPVPDLHDYTLGQCDGWVSSFECCLYGMGIGFSFNLNRDPIVGPHSYCWQSAQAESAPDTCEGDRQYFSCCLWGMGVGFFVQTYPTLAVGQHPYCWQSTSTDDAPSVPGPGKLPVTSSICTGNDMLQPWHCCDTGNGFGMYFDPNHVPPVWDDPGCPQS